MELQSRLADFEQRHAQIVALAFQDPARAQTMQQVVQATFPILADESHKVADAYGVFNRLNDNVDAPSIFIVNPQGQIVWAYVGKDAADRPVAETVLQHLP